MGNLTSVKFGTGHVIVTTNEFERKCRAALDDEKRCPPASQPANLTIITNVETVAEEARKFTLIQTKQFRKLTTTRNERELLPASKVNS